MQLSKSMETTLYERIPVSLCPLWHVIPCLSLPLHFLSSLHLLFNKGKNDLKNYYKNV